MSQPHRILVKIFNQHPVHFRRSMTFREQSLLVVLGDGATGVAAAGLADVEDVALIRVQSRMLSASSGRTFVGASALALAREGVLEPDAPVSRWLGDRQGLPACPETRQ